MRETNPEGTLPQPSEEELLYVKELEVAYLNLSGRGLMLSPLDYQILEGFAQAKIPLETAKRGFSIAFEVSRKQNPRRPPNIRFCAAFVRKEHSKATQLAVGAAPPAPPDPELGERRRLLCERLAEEGKVERDPMIREAYRRSYRRLLRLQATAEMSEKVRRCDEILCDEVYHLLSPKIRAEIDEQVELALKRSSAAAEKEALTELAHATRRRELRKRLQLFRLEL